MTFKTIPDYPAYEVSEEGEVRNIKKQRTLKQCLAARYKRVTLYKDGKSYPGLCVHALVATTFLGPPNGRCVRHLDGDPTNNFLSNLAYGSLSENQLDRLRHGTYGMALDEFKVKLIRIYAELGYKQVQIAKLFGVKPPAIGAVLRGETWSCLA